MDDGQYGQYGQYGHYGLALWTSPYVSNKILTVSIQSIVSILSIVSIVPASL